MLLACLHHIFFLNEIIVLLYLTTGYFTFTDGLKLISHIAQIRSESCCVKWGSILSVSWLLPPTARFIGVDDLASLFPMIHYCHHFRCKMIFLLIVGMQRHFWFAEAHSVPLGFLLSYSFCLRRNHLRGCRLWPDLLIINLLFLLRFILLATWARWRWWLLVVVRVNLKVSAVPVVFDHFISDPVWCHQACLIELRLAVRNFLLISLISLYLEGVYVRVYVRWATFLTWFARRCHRYVMVWLSVQFCFPSFSFLVSLLVCSSFAL